MPANSSLKLVDLVPAGTVERLKGLFEAVTHVPMVVTDADGMALTAVKKPLQFCGSLVRSDQCRTLCLRRKKWDVPEPELEADMRKQHQDGSPIQHRCIGGFRDTAVPISVDRRIIGYLVFARCLAEPPDPAKFRRLAVEGGMVPEVGDDVARHTLVMSEQEIAHVAEMLQLIADIVAMAAYETLRARQVMELEELRDNLVHMIVHDLRTPLTSIIGGLKTIIDTDYDPQLTREFVPMALSSANTLLEMVNTLLDINKMESGQMKLEIASLKFPEIASEAIDEVKGIAVERHLELSVDIAPDLPAIEGDREKIRRVLVNLLGNAVKFTQVGGHIKLSARPENGGIVFAVADDGPGIPPEFHEKIFDKFGQVEGHSQGVRHSTGLGLTFCKMAVEAHGGRIWVESEVGKGSTFFVFIPPRPPTFDRQ